MTERGGRPQKASSGGETETPAIEPGFAASGPGAFRVSPEPGSRGAALRRRGRSRDGRGDGDEFDGRVQEQAAGPVMMTGRDFGADSRGVLVVKQGPDGVGIAAKLANRRYEAGRPGEESPVVWKLSLKPSSFGGYSAHFGVGLGLKGARIHGYRKSEQPAGF